jgi:hypothetical protein
MAVSLLDFQAQTVAPLQKGIIQQITNESVFLKLLRFIPVDGFAYSYNRQQTLGGIAFRGLNASYTEDTGVINPEVEALSILGGEVRTDRQIVNKQGDSARANAIAAKAKKAGLFYDKYVIDGDPGTDPLQFYGLNQRLTGNQLITVATNGGALTLALLDQAIDAVYGANAKKWIICSRRVRRMVTTLVRAAGGATMAEYQDGQVVRYDDCGIQTIDEGGDEAAILDNDEVCGSSGVTSSLYVIRPGSEVDAEGLQGLVGSNMIEHAAVGLLGTYYSDIIEANLGLGLFHPRAACRIKGIL